MTEEKAEKKTNIIHIILFSMLLSGAIIFITFVVFVIAEMFLRDPLRIFENEQLFIPSAASIKMLCYVLIILIFFLYIPLKVGIHEHTISTKSGIIAVTLFTYLLSSVSLAIFLNSASEIVDYEKVGFECPYKDELIEKGAFKFSLKESFFDSVSGFTTTGLTAFRTKETVTDKEGKKVEIEIRKIDAQPNLIHIIRATYLFIGGLGIMFFYLYFTPVPSLMISMGYEIPAERSLPRFIRLEGLSFSLIYCIVVAFGILLLFLFISSTCQFEAQPKDVDDRNVVTYSVVLAFSSISTGGFSPESDPINKLEIKRPYKTDNGEGIGKCRINKFSILVIMVLMLVGAMPIFSMHRPLKFIKKRIIFALFLLPVLVYAMLSYHVSAEVSFYRSFDAISAFTTTGLSTSQFENDSEMPWDTKYLFRYNEERVKEIYRYRRRTIFIIGLMFIGGAAYSTAGGWGFFNFYCSIYAVYLIITGKLERVLTRYILQLILSFVIFFSIFAVGTLLCFKSGLFGSASGPEPAEVADYLINSAFYEISALSTVGLMPDSMIQNDSIYYNNLAYWTLLISMLIGRLYYIIFSFLISQFGHREETQDGRCSSNMHS